MPRIGLTLIALIIFVGCRAPGFDPLGLTGPDRVPPPPTGAVGGGYGGYGGYDNGYAPVPRPNVGQGAANWPASDFAPATQLTQASASPMNSRSTADSPPSLPRNNDQLQWVDPLEPRSAPGLLPATGQTQPLASGSPRVRGFQNASGRQNIYVPEELAHLRNNQTYGSGVRQANATSNSQQRYDDIRR